AAVSRQREYLADARAVQWTRSQNGLGGVLRKVLGQRKSAEHAGHEGPRHSGLAHPSVQHMLLVDVESSGRWGEGLAARLAGRLDSHPTLEDRVQRVYGRRMAPLPLTPVNEPPERGYRASGVGAAAGEPSLASLVDPFARL